MKYNYQELLNVETLEAEEMLAVVGGEGVDDTTTTTDTSGTDTTTDTTTEEVLPVFKGKTKNKNFRRRKNKKKALPAQASLNAI